MEGFLEGFTEGLLIGIGMLWNIAMAEPLLIGIVGLFVVGSYVLALTVNVIRKQKLKKSGILEVDKMKGKEFEEYLRVLFIERGYQVRLTPATGDYGADLVLSQNGRKTIVQAKRYKKNVGIKAVQEIASAKQHYRADECWVVTNSGYTEPARKLAQSNQVQLVDRTLLMKWMLEMKKQDEKTSDQAMSIHENNDVKKR
ncbi:restriction endonuclease [Planococcus dechangensis]|uniref:Restriction endonuclease n=1 Tax=Planococcus dechangensis TaxID=1176255 RepID=A0ABV9MD69_9BACL